MIKNKNFGFKYNFKILRLFSSFKERLSRAYSLALEFIINNEKRRRQIFSLNFPLWF